MQRATWTGIAVVAVAAIILAAAWFVARGEGKALQDLQARKEQLAQDDVATWASDADALERAVGEFRRLQRAGFTGRADPVALTDALRAAAAARRLPEPEFELAALGDTDARDAAGGLRAMNLKIVWRGVHEEEVLALLADLRERGIGLFTTRTCRLSPAAETSGLRAECVLRWNVLEPESS